MTRQSSELHLHFACVQEQRPYSLKKPKIICNIMDALSMERLAGGRGHPGGSGEYLVHEVFAARLHEAEHVEEAIVAGGGEALAEAHV